MVADAKWLDFNKDGKLDLVVVGEWMPVSLFQNTGKGLANVTEKVGLAKTNGWWNCVIVDDLNQDGYADLVAGNLGKNSKIKASESEPASLYAGDFDNNGLLDPILCFFKMEKSYPLPLRSDVISQLPYLNQKFPKHTDYAGKQITDILTERQLSKSVVKQAYTFATTVFYGNLDGTFLPHPLPTEAQFSPVYAIMAKDFDADGAKDLLLAGNFFGLTPQLGRYDASYGVLLSGSCNATFKLTHSNSNSVSGFAAVPMRNSGLSLSGQVRDMVSLKYRNKQEAILFAVNNERLQVYEVW
jgi:hypothetical protein